MGVTVDDAGSERDFRFNENWLARNARRLERASGGRAQEIEWVDQFAVYREP